jgi:hypothetical protein
MKITFKKHERETGLAAVGAGHPNVDLKIKGKVFGYISSPNWRTKDNFWRIRLMIKAEEHPGWKWIQLKEELKDEMEARDFIKANEEAIQSKYELRFAD